MDPPLGARAGGGVGRLLLARTPAEGAPITVGELSFTVPDTVRSVPVPAGTSVGLGWQWRGRGESPTSDDRAAPVVLARADLASVDPQEIAGLLLANAVDRVAARAGARRQPDPVDAGGGDQTRIDLAYAVAPSLPFHGTMLIATRPEPPAAVLVSLGSDALTAGIIDGVLDSARWGT